MPGLLARIRVRSVLSSLADANGCSSLYRASAAASAAAWSSPVFGAACRMICSPPGATPC
jgi:hypothetical protein